MRSILDSSGTSQPLLTVKNVGLVFRMPYIKNSTLRDSFVNFFKEPLQWLVNQPDRLVVFDDVSFSISAGERVGFLGVNGTGKTSICRCIAGIYSPTKGEIFAPKNIQAIFNTAVGIQPELTGRENAELLAEFIFPHDIKNKKQIVDEALAFSELGDFVDVPYKFYSNGMQARLGLSLISAKPSQLLILDEVFDGADQFFRKKIAQRVKTMIENSGAVIFVSHSTEQLLDVCNRIIIFHKGKIHFDGDPTIAVKKFNGIMQ